MSSLHDLVDSWWVPCDEHRVKRGRLIHAFVPHVGLSPYVFDVEGRPEPTEHRSALVKIRPLNVRDRHKRPELPVAALPQKPGEVWTAHRSKVRPCLVLSVGGEEIPKELRPQTSARWQTAPTILVAPYSRRYPHDRARRMARTLRRPSSSLRVPAVPARLAPDTSSR